jgi:hypothetical protein
MVLEFNFKMLVEVSKPTDFSLSSFTEIIVYSLVDEYYTLLGGS